MIAKAGPSKDDPRWNFLATNALIRMRGRRWRDWNEVLRELLVNSQRDMGVIDGSWYFPSGNGADTGGRLYHTALSALTLETYYRNAPVYQHEQE